MRIKFMEVWSNWWHISMKKKNQFQRATIRDARKRINYAHLQVSFNNFQFELMLEWNRTAFNWMEDAFMIKMSFSSFEKIKIPIDGSLILCCRFIYVQLVIEVFIIVFFSLIYWSGIIYKTEASLPNNIPFKLSKHSNQSKVN